jgi:hypothetical protein
MRASLLVIALLAACSGKDPYNPGQALGTFHVTGALTKTSCGPVPDPWEFDVKLAHDGSTFYWIQGAGPISGQVDANDNVALKASDSRQLRAADERNHVAACAVQRDDHLDVALAGDGEAPISDLKDTTRLTGKLVYRFTPTEGSDCSDQTLDTGGDYAALPCEVSYDLTAKMAKKP